jgi:hypothetical protein
MMSKVAICVTGGYYYNWHGESRLYDWLYDFCKNNTNFDPHIVSWQPENYVPDRVKAQFGKSIYYRDNHGCDWGCYNYFINKLVAENRKSEYDYIIFIHDDILPAIYDWPLKMVAHISANNYAFNSFFGRYLERNNDSRKDLLNNVNYYKELMTMCFCARADEYFFENCPFITIPGHDQKWSGNAAAMIWAHNIIQKYNNQDIGWVTTDGIEKRIDYLDAVIHFKRGSSIRKSIIHKEGETNIAGELSDKIPIEMGFFFTPGELAQHSKLNSSREASSIQFRGKTLCL